MHHWTETRSYLLAARRVFSALLVLLLAYVLELHGPQPAQAAATVAAPTRMQRLDAGQLARLRGTVHELCSAKYAGRRVGTPGADLAAKYLEGELTELGVQPVEGMPNLRLGFAVTRGIRVTGTPQVTLGGQALVYGTDYTVASFSGGGKCAQLPLVFAGYGIVAPEFSWNDYAGVDVSGKAVVIVRGEPSPKAQPEAFNGVQLSIYSDLRRKAAAARDLGASALIVLNNPRLDEPTLPELRPTYSAADFNMPVIHLQSALLKPALDLPAVLDQMDADGAPHSSVLGGAAISIELSIEKDMAMGTDLVGVFPGADAQLASQYVVIGAHYDHLGIGGPESAAPNSYGMIHPGADDNASGVAAVLEITRWAAAHRGQFKRSLLICLFAGEEVGLLGSNAVLATLPLPNSSMYCMLNMDMVGRLRESKLYLGTAESAKEFPDIINGLPERYRLTVLPDKSGLGGSDHMNFLAAGIPSLFFFTGAHPEYHTPQDLPVTLNYRGLAEVADFARDMAQSLSDHDGTLRFQKPEGVGSGGPVKKERKVTMGTTPSYEGSDLPGYMIGDVRPGGPADKAGIKPGDRVVKIGDRVIVNIYDFVFALQDLNPGDTAPVTVARDGQELTVSVTFEARSVEQ